MSSPTTDLWAGIRNLLLADAPLMALVNGVYDKRAKDEVAFAAPKFACVSRGPVNAVDDSADCIPGAEITFQLDVWSRLPNRWKCDDMVFRVRQALHEKTFSIATGVLVDMRVDLWRVMDDPDGLTTHGVVQVTAMVEDSA